LRPQDWVAFKVAIRDLKQSQLDIWSRISHKNMTVYD